MNGEAAMFIIQQVGERGRLEGKQHPELYRVILLKTYCETNTSLCLCENVRRTWTFAKRSEDKREENVPEHAKGTTFGGKTDKSLSLKLCVLSNCCLVSHSSKPHMGDSLFTDFLPDPSLVLG